MLNRRGWHLVIFAVLLLEVGLGSAYAQGNGEWTKGYMDSLAQSWPNNAIENLPDSFARRDFAGKRLTIMQLGDSHIQADFVCAATRIYLTEQFGFSNVARGYVFPFGAIRTNEPSDIRSKSSRGWIPHFGNKEKHDQSLGLAASAMETKNAHAKLTVRLKPEKVFASPAQQLTVLFKPGANIPTPRINGRTPDSLDAESGRAIYALPDSVERIVLSFTEAGQRMSPFRLLGFLFDNPDSPFIFHGAGRNGAMLSSVLRNTELQPLVQQIEPDIIILSLGTNDCYWPRFSPEAYRAELVEATRRLHQAQPNALILLTTPPDLLYKRKRINPRASEAVRVVREVAEKHGYAFWDLYSIMGGAGSRYSWIMHDLSAKDGIHFTPMGYRLQGRLLGVALQRILESLN